MAKRHGLILKYGPDVEIIDSDKLCKLHVEKLRVALDNYILESPGLSPRNPG